MPPGRRPIMKEEAKEVLKTMHDMTDSAEECFYLLQSAFIQDSPEPLKECAVKVERIKIAEPELTRKILEMSRDDESLKPYIAVPAHLVSIADNIQKIAGLISKKIKDSVIFSDKAMTETIYLLQRLGDILRPVSKIILSQYVFLNRYVQESQALLTSRATGYATLHEERLIEGLCLPVASSLYINMLDAVKDIAWHSKEIALKIAGPVPTSKERQP